MLGGKKASSIIFRGMYHRTSRAVVHKHEYLTVSFTELTIKLLVHFMNSLLFIHAFLLDS